MIYNRAYDTGRLLWELHLHHLALGTVDFTMEQYAAFYGEWHDYFGSYTWQKLGGGHRALGDAHAVIRRLEEMAAYPSPFDRMSEPAAV